MSTPTTGTRRARASLVAAKSAKNDEFYTRLPDIEAELRHYRPHFKDKVVLCNCDDPFESNFFKYFVMNFDALGLKKLIASCYSGSVIQGEQLSLFDVNHIDDADREAKKPYKVEITELTDLDGDGAVSIDDVELLLRANPDVVTVLGGDGDFRSSECIELLKEADIVVTNPPFSLFRDYVAQLFEHDKQFLIVGNSNAITYSEIFPLIQANRMWLGMKKVGSSRAQSDMYFDVTPEWAAELVATKKEGDGYIRIDGKVYARLGNAAWFTNLDHDKRHENLILTQRYNSARYPAYNNFDGIEVSHIANIPEDWTGVMGVPITFLDKYNPEQFEIVRFRKGDDGKDLNYTKPDGTVASPYFRILIRRIGRAY